jgi:hypothetical protein
VNTFRAALFVLFGFAIAGCGLTPKGEVVTSRCIDARGRPMPMIATEGECRFEAGQWHATPAAAAASSPLPR